LIQLRIHTCAKLTSKNLGVSFVYVEEGVSAETFSDIFWQKLRRYFKYEWFKYKITEMLHSVMTNIEQSL
jgi:hypothetical protein